MEEYVDTDECILALQPIIADTENANIGPVAGSDLGIAACNAKSNEVNINSNVHAVEYISGQEMRDIQKATQLSVESHQNVDEEVELLKCFYLSSQSGYMVCCIHTHDDKLVIRNNGLCFYDSLALFLCVTYTTFDQV